MQTSSLCCVLLSCVVFLLSVHYTEASRCSYERVSCMGNFCRRCYGRGRRDLESNQNKVNIIVK